MCVCTRSCPTLQPQGLEPTRLLHGIFQARTLECVAIFSSRLKSPTTSGLWKEAGSDWQCIGQLFPQGKEGIGNLTTDVRTTDVIKFQLSEVRIHKVPLIAKPRTAPR